MKLGESIDHIACLLSVVAIISGKPGQRSMGSWAVEATEFKSDLWGHLEATREKWLSEAIHMRMDFKVIEVAGFKSEAYFIAISVYRASALLLIWSSYVLLGTYHFARKAFGILIILYTINKRMQYLIEGKHLDLIVDWILTWNPSLLIFFLDLSKLRGKLGLEMDL